MKHDHEQPRERRREARRFLARKVSRNGAHAFFHTLTRSANAEAHPSRYGHAPAGGNEVGGE